MRAVMAIKNESQTRKRGAGKPFAPGNPGGPGRPVGSRNAATILLDEMADGDAQTVLKKVLDAAKAGDLKAAEIVLGRIWPARKGPRVQIDLPEIKTASDVLAALGAVVQSAATGEITPEQASALAGILETKRRAIETVDLEARLTRIEAATGAAR